MTEQNQTPYTFKTAETLQADALIRKAAAKIIQDNIASQETVSAHLSEVRKKLAQAKPPKKSIFSTSYLREFASKRRAQAAQKLNVVGC